MERSFARVAVVQLAYHPAIVLGTRSPLEDPGGAEPLLPASADAPEGVRPELEALRRRIRGAYSRQLLARVQAALEACRGWGVRLVVLPEYSVPWEVLEGIARAAGDMVVVAGTHMVDRHARNSGVYERLGWPKDGRPRNGQAVAPVLHSGRLLALSPKFHPATAVGEEIVPGEVWTPVEMPDGIVGPMGVMVCLDFRYRENPEHRGLVAQHLERSRFLAVPSLTPWHSVADFAHQAWDEAKRYGRPVLYTNIAEHGGTSIFVDEEKHSSLRPFPDRVGSLEPGEEGVIVADIDLGHVRSGGSTRYDHARPVRPFAAASFVYRREPDGEAYARWLEEIAPLLARDDDEALEELSERVEGAAQMLASMAGAKARRERLDRLRGDLRHVTRVEQIRQLTREVLMPADVLSFDVLRAALARGAAEAAQAWLGDHPELGAVVKRLREAGNAAKGVAAKAIVQEVCGASTAPQPVEPNPLPSSTSQTSLTNHADAEKHGAQVAAVLAEAAPPRVAGGGQDGAKKMNPPEVSIARLPTVDARIFGRCADTAWLDACWAEGVNVASIIAFGGVGKSALAWDWLRGMQRDDWRGAERVYGWSFYSQGTTDRATSADEFISAALLWFGDADPNAGSPWDKGERLARLIRKQRVLLVLDGVEPLQWGPGPQEGSIKDPALATLIRELGAQSLGLCVITSRLAVREAEDFAAESCRRLDLSTLTEEAGAELLRARGVKGTEAELREAAREYGGHGLALALLGSYLEEVGEGDVRRRREIGPLVDDERLGGHARRVTAAYEKMLGGGSVEVAILRMLGLFDRPADEGEIVALRAEPVIPGLTDAVVGHGTKEWNRAVAKLRRVGLLAAEGAQDRRLDAHPLVREHFAAQLRRDRAEAWREGHRRLYEYLKGKARELPETIEEMAPLYAAVVHGCLAGKHQETLAEVYRPRIQRNADLYYNVKVLGAFGAQAAVLQGFFAEPWSRVADGITNTGDRAFLFAEAGYCLKGLGRMEEAIIAPMSAALDLRTELEEWHNAAVAAGNMSDAHLALGKVPEALNCAKMSYELALRSGVQEQIQGKAVLWARAAHYSGDCAGAESLFCSSEQLFLSWFAHVPDSPFAFLFGYAGFAYCELLLDQGRHLEAELRAVQALEIAKQLGFVADIATAHLTIALAQLSKLVAGGEADSHDVMQHVHAAVEVWRKAGRLAYVPLGLLARAALHTHTGAFDLAQKDLDEAHRIATRCGFRLHEADAHLGLARLCLAEEDPTPALDHLATARKLIDETGYHRRDGELAELEAKAAEMAKAAPPPVPSPPPSAPTPTKPMPQPPATQHVDVGIVIALKEEATQLLDLAGGYVASGDGSMNSYLFTRGSYRCVATLVGPMGEMEAARVTERQITVFDPAAVISIGISGGCHGDLRVGDVYVPQQAVQYLQDAKALPAERGGFHIAPGPPSVQPEFDIYTKASGFDLNHPRLYGRWREDCRRDLEALLPDASVRERLFAEDLVRPEVALVTTGHEASGPVVGAAEAFTTWIRSFERNIKAVDMETAAVLATARSRHPAKPALAIRGISDYGDDRKAKLDAIGSGSLRRYAMRNAVRLLWALLDAEALPLTPRPIAPGAVDAVPPGTPAPAPVQGTRWPAKLSGAEVQELVNALLSAFSSRSALAQMLRIGLNENLDAIAAPGNLRATIFEVVSHAEAQGFISALFDAALAAAPGNPDLLAVATKRRA